jgi:hypothetical protein
MLVCPKCGHGGGFPLPMTLWAAAFLIMYFVWINGDYTLQASRSDRHWALTAFFVFDAGTIWAAVRNLRHRQRHRLHEGMQQIEREKQEATQRAKT